MKKLFFGLLLLETALVGGMAAPASIYINNSPLSTPPQVDATIFLNRSSFDVFTTQPFQAQNVQFWTNTASMSGVPGYRFEFDRSGKRTRGVRANSRNLQMPSTTFYNDGNISGDTLISIRAKTIFNSGRLDGGETARISIQATNGFADLGRSGIRVGPPTGLAVPCDFPSVPSTNFIQDPNIVDLYWGGGRNNYFGTNGTRLDLTLLPIASDGSLTLPSPITPSHQVIELLSGRPFTNLVSLPQGSLFGGLCGTDYQTFVYTNENLAGTTIGTAVTIVFVPTRSLLSENLSVDVRFIPDSGPGGTAYAPVVEFHSMDFDIVDQLPVTNYVTFIDTTGSQTNVLLARPSALLTTSGTIVRPPNTRRPSTYTVIRGRYCDFDFASPANTVYDPSIFYSTNFVTNMVNTIYAAYSAQVGATNTQQFVPTTVRAGLQVLGINPATTDPTNFNGKVEIDANVLNMNLARIKAENFISIKANNLTSNLVAQLDAPFLDFNLQSSNSPLVIHDLAPPFVNRLGGQIAAWSSVWNVNVTNTFRQTNNMRFHVLVIDNCLRSEQPVTLNHFAARTPQLVVQDNLFVNAGILVNAPAICIETNATLALPLGSDWAFTNVQNLLNFTNNGTVSVLDGAYFGSFDVGHVNPPKKKKKKKPVVPSALDNFVSHGSLSAAALFVRATNAEVTGITSVPTVFSADSGVISVTASELSLSNATIVAGSDAEFHANDLHVSRTFVTAGTTNNGLGRAIRGAIVFDGTNSLGDDGILSSNLWLATSGVRVPTLPVNPGDLMGTHVYLTAGPFWEAPIVWAGEDRGATPSGFSNNLALGRLTLDGNLGNLFRFRSPTTNTALYVDYLELLNSATNYNFAVGVSPGFTIYIADSNISPEKLAGISGGRVRWVSDFTGPQSSTNITYPNGITYTFNAGVVRSRDRDDDNDGFVNAEDCTPLPVDADPIFWFGSLCPAPSPLRASSVASTGIFPAASAMNLQIALSTDGETVSLNWNAPARSANTVEFTESLASGEWQTLTNFINGPVDARVRVQDAAGAPVRIYRVRVDGGRP
jgi:hypothetical protein